MIFAGSFQALLCIKKLIENSRLGIYSFHEQKGIFKIGLKQNALIF